MANLYKVDGTIEVVHPANGKHWTLKEMQDLVGGFIEFLPSIRAKIVVNEEGLIKGLPVNEKATALYLNLLATKKKNAGPLWYKPELRGNVLALVPGEKMGR